MTLYLFTIRTSFCPLRFILIAQNHCMVSQRLNSKSLLRRISPLLATSALHMLRLLDITVRFEAIARRAMPSACTAPL